MVTEAPQVAITGASGLIGGTLVPFLSAGGHHVARLVRSRQRSGEDAIYWNPQRGEVDHRRLEGFHAVVHLAGENLASGRWTAARKRRIWESRVQGTQVLCETLARLERKPHALVSASAVGLYGDRGREHLEEDSSPGEGFLPELCRAWEAATAPAAAAGIRVVNLRMGVVLSPAGGALAKMLPPFKLGLGGRLGSGRQSMSWIHIDDAVSAILHALTHPVDGPVNATAPEPVTNADFTRTLASVLRRPALLPVPAPALKLALGRELAEQTLLCSQRVHPARLIETGFQWRYPQLDLALRHLLGR